MPRALTNLAGVIIFLAVIGGVLWWVTDARIVAPCASEHAWMCG